MKKLLLLFVFILPLMSCSEIVYKEYNYDYNWYKFINDNRYDNGSGKRLWKYGYVKKDGITYPKEPPGFQTPDYLRKHPLVGKDLLNLDNVVSKMPSKKDAVEIFKFNRGGFVMVDGFKGFSDGKFWGVTKEGMYFPIIQGTTSTPFRNIVNSLLITIETNCAIDGREPTMSEKYYVLFYSCSDPHSLDVSYYAKHQNEIETSWLAEQVFGTMKIFIICFFFIFCMMIPAIAILLIKRFTPEGSILHSAASFVEWLIILVGGATLVRAITKK